MLDTQPGLRPIALTRQAWSDAQPDLDPERLAFIDKTGASTNMCGCRAAPDVVIAAGHRCHTALEVFGQLSAAPALDGRVGPSSPDESNALTERCRGRQLSEKGSGYVRSQITSNGDAAVFYLIYRSSARLGRRRVKQEAAIGSILSQSRIKNSRLGITGVLFFSGRSFIQHLEGPLTYVEAAFDCIERDVRHTNVHVVHRGWQERRQYASWSMIYVGRDTTVSARQVASLVDTSDMVAASGPIVESLLHKVVDDYLAGP